MRLKQSERVHKMKVCNKCGTEVEPGVKFCSECGAKIKTDEQKTE